MAADSATAGRPPAKPGFKPPAKPGFKITQRAWWPMAKRVATVAFFALVIYLVTVQARAVNWAEVKQSVRAYPAAVLWGAAAVALLSHALYATYDLISRHHVKHGLSAPAVLATTFISYAFNLNFGSLVGGVAFRFRLYSRQGLETGVISHVYGMSMITNWLGYLVLAGVVCLVQPIAPPAEWPVGSGALRVVGVVFLALASVYLGLCAFSKKRTVSVRGHEAHLPSLQLALLQVVVSCLNWSLIAGTVWVLLQQRVDFPSVLMVMLAAAVAGVITHVPAGIGVLEAVVVTMLSQHPKSELLAALLVYRAFYYLVPLAIAIVLFVAFELRLKKAQAAGAG